MPLKIIILGPTSLIGESLANIFSVETDYKLLILTTNVNNLKIQGSISIAGYDVSDKKSFRQIILAEKPDVIINAANYSCFENCESQRNIAWQINVNLMENLSGLCKILNAHLICFSSDMVFDGEKGPYSETDKPSPINYFGKSKLAGENACKAQNIDYTIIRTSIIYGYSTYRKNDFVSRLISRLSSEEETFMPAIYRCNPVFSDDVSRGVIHLVRKQRKGIYHFGCGDFFNLYELTQVVSKVYGFDGSKVKLDTSAQPASQARLPVSCGLITLKAETDLGLKFSSFADGLLSIKHQTAKNFKLF